MSKGYREISPQEVHRRQAAGETFSLIDIRRPEEWQQTGVVADSCLLTLFDRQGQGDPRAWLDQVLKYTPDQLPLVLICRSGYRSRLACEFLGQVVEGRSICNLSDGILGWLAAGLPVVNLKSNGEPL